jgi:hypothetical protein
MVGASSGKAVAEAHLNTSADVLAEGKVNALVLLVKEISSVE